MKTARIRNFLTVALICALSVTAYSNDNTKRRARTKSGYYKDDDLN